MVQVSRAADVHQFFHWGAFKSPLKCQISVCSTSSSGLTDLLISEIKASFSNVAVQKLGTSWTANTCNNSSGVSESAQGFVGPGARRLSSRDEPRPSEPSRKNTSQSLKAEGLLTGALWNAERWNCWSLRGLTARGSPWGRRGIFF